MLEVKNLLSEGMEFNCGVPVTKNESTADTDVMLRVFAYFRMFILR